MYTSKRRQNAFVIVIFTIYTFHKNHKNDFLPFLHRILRHRGHFGNVSVMWQLFQNVSLQSGQEFYETSGTVSFIDREGSKPIILHAFPDRIPEFNEFYILKLVNISGEDFLKISYLSPKFCNICFIQIVYKIQMMVKCFMIV